MAKVLFSRKQGIALSIFVIIDIAIVCTVTRLFLTKPFHQVLMRSENSGASFNLAKSYHETLMKRSTPWYIRSDCEMEEPIINLREKDSIEFETVRENLDKCFQSADLIEYFHDSGFYNRAVRNAAHLLSLVRSVVPQNFSRTFNAPCWWAPFEVNLLSKRLVGCINGNAFTSPKHCWKRSHLEAMELVYYRNKSSKLVCLPSIFLAGFPKCGSTYMYCLLRSVAYRAHHVSGWRGEIDKEPRMWVSTGPDYHHQYPHQLTDLTRYLFNFMPYVDAVLSSQYSLAIDASPNLLFQWPRYTPWESMENYCLLPAVLPQILPNNKYIVVMREPASMLYSAFWFSCSHLNVTLTRQQQIDAPNVFHEDVVKAIEIFQKCTVDHPTDKCIDTVFHSRLRNSSTQSCLRLRFEMGFYYNYIRRWLAVVPRRQFLFLTTEELSRTPPYKELLEITGIKESSKSNESTYSDIECWKNKSKFQYKDDSALGMRNDTKKLLDDFFAPFNLKLANLLQDSKFLWKK